MKDQPAQASAPALVKGPEYDVIILGAGLAGSILGAIMARHGARTLIVDAGSHPRFAVGESMIPYTLLALRSMAERYDVPEIATLSSYDSCNKEISTSFGWKKHFGFMRHQEGAEPDPMESNQFSTPGIFNKTGHLYRQDTDTYLFNAAVRYGCDQRLGMRVKEVEIEDGGIAVVSTNNEVFRGRYLVDASGFRSPLAEKLDLRERPSRFKHHSRSLFTHMIDVPITDDVLRHAKRDRPPKRWWEGTMHHLFDRGWFWVIPFNNNPHSTNPLVSVGLTMDPRKYPKDTTLTPEEEFHAFAARFPAVERQFTGARAVRPWVSTDRLQYSSKASVGDRWCLMSHAAGFLDPLFSRGLSNTAEVINALAWRLMAALKDDVFTRERFAYVEQLEQGLLDYNDELVNSAFISFDHYQLWNAVFRVWAMGSNMGAFRILRALNQFRRTGSDASFHAMEQATNTGLWWPDHDEYRKLFDTTVTECEAVEKGVTTPDRASDAIFTMLENADYFPPAMGFQRRDLPFINPTPKMVGAVARWAFTKAPPDTRDLMLGTVKDIARAGVRVKRAI